MIRKLLRALKRAFEPVESGPRRGAKQINQDVRRQEERRRRNGY